VPFPPDSTCPIWFARPTECPLSSPAVRISGWSLEIYPREVRLALADEVRRAAPVLVDVSTLPQGYDRVVRDRYPEPAHLLATEYVPLARPAWTSGMAGCGGEATGIQLIRQALSDKRRNWIRWQCPAMHTPCGSNGEIAKRSDAWVSTESATNARHHLPVLPSSRPTSGPVVRAGLHLPPTADTPSRSLTRPRPHRTRSAI